MRSPNVTQDKFNIVKQLLNSGINALQIEKMGLMSDSTVNRISKCESFADYKEAIKDYGKTKDKPIMLNPEIMAVNYDREILLELKVIAEALVGINNALQAVKFESKNPIFNWGRK